MAHFSEDNYDNYRMREEAKQGLQERSNELHQEDSQPDRKQYLVGEDWNKHTDYVPLKDRSDENL